MSERIYIHGYSEEEQRRLLAQNEVLAKFIYQNIDLSVHQRVLEVGCGVGAQMIYMLRKYPHLHVTGLELERKQIETATKNLDASEIDPKRYSLIQGDATDLGNISLDAFDAVVMIWVLEHIDNPLQVISELFKKLTSGTQLYITEVFHRSFHLHPYSEHVDKFWMDMMDFQEKSGGDANVGLKLGDYLHRCGFKIQRVAPFPVFFDIRHPELRKEMLEYWLDLSRSAVPEMKEAGYLKEKQWQLAEEYLKSMLDNPNAVFYYSFMQAKAEMP